MTDRSGDRLRAGVQSALLHFAKAGYEVVSGVGALVEGVVTAVRKEPDDDEDRGSRVQRIDVD